MRSSLAQVLERGARLGLLAGGASLVAFACSSTNRTFDDPPDLGGAGGDDQASGARPSMGGSSAGEAPSPSSGSGGDRGGTSPEGGRAAAGGVGDESGGVPPASPCDDNDCRNGASCKVVGSAYQCDCADGFNGDKCEVDIDDCAAHPCQNEGTCTDKVADYSCACPDGFTGHDCSLPRFEPLPIAFTVSDVSPDGTVVVGSANDHGAKYVAGALKNLGAYIGDSESEAYGASKNGDVIVGASMSTSLSTGVTSTRPVRWVGTGITELPKPKTDDNCSATDVSANGKVIVGSCVDSTGSTQSIVRWVDGVLQNLGTPSSTDWCYSAIVSDDGSTTFGSCSIASDSLPFRWTQADGMVLLSSPNNCRVKGTSTDGKSATGFCASSGASSQAFEWTAAGGVKTFSGSQLLDATASFNSA
ncbi:MAG TPA: hypothetical protein VEQ59_11125, partial [Polyangiaceae bacterium]|nr:hypothetical protein [Polyangiaceae bacterium]